MIDPFYFCMALAVGLLYTYLTAPKPTVVIKYPTPYNAGKITYVDDAGVCYRYRVNPVDCGNNEVKSFPIQNNFALTHASTAHLSEDGSLLPKQ